MLTTEWKSYIYMCEKKHCEYLLSVFSKEKHVKKCLCFFKIRVLHLLVCIDIFLHKIQGDGGARGATHVVILFNPLRLKSDLNEGLSVLFWPFGSRQCSADARKEVRLCSHLKRSHTCGVI